MGEKGIAIIGRTADGCELLDGQTVKTKVLRDELQRSYPGRRVVCVDTFQYKKHAISILWKTIRAFCTCGDIFVLLSKNGRAIFIPFLTGLNRLFRRRMYHDVIGASMPQELAGNQRLIACMNRFRCTWVETPALRDALCALGVERVEVLPNFKRLQILSARELPDAQGDVPVFVTFSRIAQHKGIDLAVAAMKKLNEGAARPRAILHIYGQVEPDYREEFAKILADAGENVVFKGSVPYARSVQELQSAYMLLFPSTYPGEGLPGTLIDAFSAGLPVITNDWHYNSDLVSDGETGYVYRWQKPEMLAERMAHALAHPEEVARMRLRCLQEARKYTPEANMPQILRAMTADAEVG